MFDWEALIPAFFNEAITPVAKELGQCLSDWIYVTFSSVMKKKRIHREFELECFFNELREKVEKIPEKDLCEPEMNVLGPALEASKYYYDKFELRNMFATIISSSMNCNKQNYIHPAFVEIIKQLSVLDKQNISLFRPKTDIKYGIGMGMETYIDGELVSEHPIETKIETMGYHFPEVIFPIVNYYLNNNNSANAIYANSNVFLENLEYDDIELNSASITNLSRLGLIETNFNAKVDDSKYDKFYTHKSFTRIKDSITKKSQSNSIGVSTIRGNTVFSHSYDDLNLQKGIVRLTQFGYYFISTCVLDELIVTY